MKRHTKALVKVLQEQLTDIQLGAEVGVWEGENSENLLRKFPQLVLIMVDKYLALNETEKHHHRRMASFSQERFNQARELAINRTGFAADRRLLHVATSGEASTKVVVESLDFVFIDGSHDYDSVKQDILLWNSKVRPGGIVAGHDYNGRGDASGRFGVKKAVDEFYGGQNVNQAGGLVWWIKKGHYTYQGAS